ncbi:bacterioferritin [Crenobacter luteus]|uniref:Bacterioferritin n=1 Tax=Crenobacter luteus TaxID=1452487 RepID=A0A161SKK9_9NEIS|nr:bacterioferritin [Crenobacter luteus]KZE34830.1 bacterioferritin [Crenobacter luteus]TCP15243.1 bacterioferritin [Crenobacter luteus]
MKGNKAVLEALNKQLAGELTSRDQYFIHSRMYHDWGMNKLFERLNHEMEEESGHAAGLISRILFLEGTPAMTPGKLNVGRDVESMLANDLRQEYDTVAMLRAAIEVCEREGDYVSRALLSGMLDDTEEDHTHWLEMQLGLIKQMGLENYIQSQS